MPSPSQTSFVARLVELGRSSIARETAWYAGALVVGQLIAFVSFPIITRLLGAADYGLYTAMLSFSGWFLILVTFGGHASLTRYFALTKDAPERQKIVSAWLLTELGLGLLAVLLLLPFAQGASQLLLDRGDLGMLLVCLVAAELGFVLCKGMQQLLRFDFRAAAFAVLVISTQVISTSLILGFLLAGWSLPGLVLARGITAGVMILAYLAISRGYVRPDYDRETAVKLVRFGLPLVPAALLWGGFSTVDRLMLIHHSEQAAGLYAAAHELVKPLWFINVALGLAWSPRAFQIYRDHPEQAPQLYGQILHAYLFGVALLGIVVCVFCKEALLLLTGPEYWAAAGAVGFLTINVLCDGSTYVTQLGPSIMERTKLMVWPPLLAFVINIVLNLLLIPHYGHFGAAAASGLSYLGLGGCYFAINQAVLPIDVPRAKVLGVLFLYLGSLPALIYLSQFGLEALPWKLAAASVPIALLWLVRPKLPGAFGAPTPETGDEEK